MFIYLLISLRILVRDYERLCVFMFIPVLVNYALWIFSWINMDLVWGCTAAEVHVPDPPGSSGSSSTPSGESTRRSCTKCLGRMSSFSLHKHLFYTKCHVSECSMNTRCNECM